MHAAQMSLPPVRATAQSPAHDAIVSTPTGVACRQRSHQVVSADDQRERSIQFAGEQMLAWIGIDNAVARFWLRRQNALIEQRSTSPEWVRAIEAARGLG